jgi:hypothetical protein
MRGNNVITFEFTGISWTTVSNGRINYKSQELTLFQILYLKSIPASRYTHIVCKYLEKYLQINSQ